MVCLERLKFVPSQLLICSDTLARGMDFAGVTCVINYNIPAHFNTYLHRAGRTGRAGEEGTVYSILSGEEVRLRMDCILSRGLGKRILHIEKCSCRDWGGGTGIDERLSVAARAGEE